MIAVKHAVFAAVKIMKMWSNPMLNWYSVIDFKKIMTIDIQKMQKQKAKNWCFNVLLIKEQKRWHLL